MPHGSADIRKLTYRENVQLVDTTSWWDVDLETMPDFRMSMQRIYAWFEGAIIDRAPIRFQAHNAFVEEANIAYPKGNLRERWFDTEFQVETYLDSIRGQSFRGETFPIYWPNLGPEVYSGFY